jgi:rhomboid protease GluP
VKGLVEIDRCQTRAEAEQRASALMVAGVQCSLVPIGDAFGIYVDEINVGRACEQLAIYESAFTLVESPTRLYPKSRKGLLGQTLYAATLAALFLAHQLDAFSINWLAEGAGQAGLIADGAWWRTITSLTLHAEFGHLLGNLIFGAVTGYFVAQCFGSGLAWFLILLAGSLGNGINAFVHSPEYTAIGASTGLFGALGILSGYSHGCKFSPWRHGLRRWVPVVAGITLLAFLGFGGENTDVVGHVLGFGAGVAIGLVVARDPQRLTRRAHIQRNSGALACTLVTLAWLLALLD